MPVPVKYVGTRTKFPTATDPTDFATLGALTAAAGGPVALGDLYRPMLGVWPAVDATNGPLTADAGITNVAPSFTGLTYYGWNSGRFNAQSQNWSVVPTSNGPTVNQCCQNTTTNRGNNYGSTGLGYPSHSDFSFVADTATVIIAYWQTTSFNAANGVYSSYNECQVFAEDGGQMKGIRQMPAVWPHGTGGNQMMYRVLTFSQALRREFRVMLSAGDWLAGVYVDTGAQMSKAPNRPILMGCFGDSWAEPIGNVLNFNGGNSAQAGVTWPTGCSQLYSNTALQYAIASGFAVIIGHQGGTGWFATANSGLSSTDPAVIGATTFASQNQADYFWNNWGSRNPMAGVFGGHNDGSYTTAVYQAQVDAGLRRLLAKNPAMPILVEGIQNKYAAAGNGYDLNNRGIANAVIALKAAGYNMCGFIDNIGDANYADLGVANLGPDGLHPTVKGGNFIGVNRAKRSATFTVPRSFVITTLAA